MQSYLQSWSNLVLPECSATLQESRVKEARVCWQCGTLWRAGGSVECPECGMHACFDVPGVSVQPVRIDLCFLPGHVVTTLVELPYPAYVFVLRSMSRWARLVKRHVLRTVQFGRARVSPPVWNADSLLVLHIAPPDGANSAGGPSMKPARPDPREYQFLQGDHRCPNCSRIRWCGVRAVGPVCAYVPTAVCLCRIPDVSYMQRSLAGASSVSVHGVHVGSVVPLYLVVNYD